MTPSEHDELQKALRVLAERIVKTCREEIGSVKYFSQNGLQGLA